MIMSNVVTGKVLREVQSKTLNELKEILKCSFGPMGSNSCIKLDGSMNQYSKDGHTILSNVRYNGIIEQAVVDDLREITRHITITVGDGTTSAVILSAIIFDKIVEMMNSIDNAKSPAQFIKDFKDAVEQIKNMIISNGRETTIDDIYNVALISTNDNEDIAQNIKDIYEEFGMGVFIDVAISNSTDSMIKAYDGMTIDSGYADTCFINHSDKNISSIRDACLYVFEDPIDTEEMIGLFDTILENNIIIPYNQNNMEAVVSTVILAPKISRDMSTYMGKLAEFMYKITDERMRPPLLIVTNIYQQDLFMDIAKLSDAKLIKKYIDPKVQELDIKNGLAATPETVVTFAGHCDEVVSDSVKTKFINPKNMKDEDGNYSATFNTMIEYLENELAKAKLEGADANVTGSLKRRINSLKANMVDYLVGGVSMADRDSIRDLVEDAVLNCRSAATYGVGYGANFEGLSASAKLDDEYKHDHYIFSIIADAYKELIGCLYKTCMSDIIVKENVSMSLEAGQPLNLSTFEFDNKVLSSIQSDVVVLDTIAKIITIMVTCNQFLVPTPLHNVYMMNEENK